VKEALDIPIHAWEENIKILTQKQEHGNMMQTGFE
jgi:hypothetical protein